MYRLLLIVSLIPIAIALAARWWFGLRVLTIEGARRCRCDLEKWMPAPGDAALVHRAEHSAAEFGRQLREKALADWRTQDLKAAASRESSRRFGAAVPPLSGIVAVLAVLVGKVPLFGAVAVFLSATALSAAFGLFALPPELAAITRAAKKARNSRSFPRQEDEEAVVRCALASAWDEALPPVLRWIHKEPSP